MRRAQEGQKFYFLNQQFVTRQRILIVVCVTALTYNKGNRKPVLERKKILPWRERGEGVR